MSDRATSDRAPFDLIAVLPFALVLALLTTWLAPSVAWFDSGELAAAAVQLGVPHPTGFPLFDLAGHLFARLPLASSALRVHFLGATAAVLGVWLWRRSLRLPALPLVPGLLAETALLLLPLLAPAVLLHVRAAEVYPLVWLLTGAIAWCWTGLRPGRRVVALGLLAGLGAGVHVEAAGLAGLAWLAAVYFLLRGERWAGIQTVALSLGLGLFGAASVAYLPLAAAHNPLFSWGDVTTLPALVDHLTAASIRQAFADRIGGAREGLAALLHLWIHNAAWLLAPALLGLAWLWRGRPGAAFLTLVLVTLDAAYSAIVNPMGLRDDQAGLIALLGLGLLAGVAAHLLLDRLRNGALQWLALALVLTAVGFAMLGSLRRAPQHDLQAGGIWADGLWHEVPPGALLVAASDHTASACLWTQTAEGARPDALCLPEVFARDPRMLAWLARVHRRPGFAQAAIAAREGRSGPEVLAAWLRPNAQQAPVLWELGHAEEDAQVSAHLHAGLPWFRLDPGSIDRPTQHQEALAMQLAVDLTCTTLGCEQAPTLAAHLGTTLGLLGAARARTDHGDAVRLLEASVRLAPNSASALNNLAVLALDVGQAGRALALCEQALAAQPDYLRAHRTAARAALKLRRWDDAESHARRYLDGKRRNREALHWLSVLVAEAPEPAKARLQALGP